MACTSGSVKNVVDKTTAARDQIEKLQNMITAQDSRSRTFFLSQIDEHLRKARIGDARELSYSSEIKTEYASEFSIDKISAVVVNVLKALAAVKNPQVKNPAMSDEAIQSYTAVVNSVAEAAKSSSASAASLSFSMTRITPGMFAFLYATSVNIKDKDTFGSETVTTTAIYYRLMQSIQDVAAQASFDSAFIDYENIIKLKKLQAALLDSLASGASSIEEWVKIDRQYSNAIDDAQKRLSSKKFITPTNEMLVNESNTAGVDFVVRRAIAELATKDGAYKDAIETATIRLNSNYFQSI